MGKNMSDIVIHSTDDKSWSMKQRPIGKNWMSSCLRARKCHTKENIDLA